jgi:hypothetical protein
MISNKDDWAPDGWDVAETVPVEFGATEMWTGEGVGYEGEQSPLKVITNVGDTPIVFQHGQRLGPLRVGLARLLSNEFAVFRWDAVSDANVLFGTLSANLDVVKLRLPAGKEHSLEVTCRIDKDDLWWIESVAGVESALEKCAFRHELPKLCAAVPEVQALLEELLRAVISDDWETAVK